MKKIGQNSVDESRKPFAEQAWFAFAALLFLFYAVVILLHPQPPLLGDLGDWIYSGDIIALHMHGLPDAAHALKHYPVPNSTLTALLGALCYFVSWQAATRIYLVVHLVVCFFACRSLARAAAAPAELWAAVPTAAFLSLGMWYGWFAFQAGVALLFFFIAALLRHREDGNLPAGYSALLVLMFFSHMVPFTFACLLLILFAWQHRRWRLLWQMAPAALLLLWYTVARFAAGNPDAASAQGSGAHYLGSFFFAYKLNTLFKSFGFVNPADSALATGHSVALATFGSPIFVLLFLANAAVTLAALALLARVAVNELRSHGSERFFWQAVVLALAAYLLVPESMLGISDPGARIAQTAIWPALFLCRARFKADVLLWRVVAAASIPLAIAAAVLFVKIPWQSTATVVPKHLPHPVEALGKVPYAHSALFINALDRDDFTLPVFPTALLLNTPQGNPAVQKPGMPAQPSPR